MIFDPFNQYHRLARDDARRQSRQRALGRLAVVTAACATALLLTHMAFSAVTALPDLLLQAGEMP